LREHGAFPAALYGSGLPLIAWVHAVGVLKALPAVQPRPNAEIRALSGTYAVCELIEVSMYARVKNNCNGTIAVKHDSNVSLCAY